MKYKCIPLLLAFVLLGFSHAVFAAWSPGGVIPNTSLEYDELQVQKNGVSILMVNSSDVTVRISARLFFLDSEFNPLGETFFAIREIAPGAQLRYNGNFLKGNWKKVQKSPRIRWELFTYEELR